MSTKIRNCTYYHFFSATTFKTITNKCSKVEWHFNTITIKHSKAEWDFKTITIERSEAEWEFKTITIKQSKAEWDRHSQSLIAAVLADLKTNAAKMLGQNHLWVKIGIDQIYINFRWDIDRGYIGICKNHTSKKDIDFQQDNDFRFQVELTLFQSSNLV